MKVIVDADSCPFREDIIEIATGFGISVIMVLSVSHYYHEDNENVKLIVVDNVSQAADIKIYNITSPGDLVVTGDFGLASLVLSKHAFCVSPRGKIYRSSNIDYLLAERHRDAKMRLAGKRTRGPSKLSSEDKENLRSVIIDFLNKCEKK